MPTLSDAEAWRRIAAARVAYLATVRADGQPHVVPIVFAVDDDRTIYSIADPKPKSELDLLRHRNIAANAATSLLVEHYDEAWEHLWWVRVDGTGRVEARSRSVALLEIDPPHSMRGTLRRPKCASARLQGPFGTGGWPNGGMPVRIMREAFARADAAMYEVKRTSVAAAS
jgi:PPOX class probable F420-dependent enzyme